MISLLRSLLACLQLPIVGCSNINEALDVGYGLQLLDAQNLFHDGCRTYEVRDKYHSQNSHPSNTVWPIAAGWTAEEHVYTCGKNLQHTCDPKAWRFG